MKKMLVIASILGLATAFSAHADKGGDNGSGNTCKKSTLKGVYVFHSSGVVGGNAYAESGNESFDGRGHVVGHVVDSTDAHGELIGTYVINPDCSGTITYTSPEPLEEDIHLGPKGDFFTYIDHHPGTGEVVSGEETRQSN